MAVILRYAHLNPDGPTFSYPFFQVSYVKDSRNWQEPKELFEAMFELYNLVSIIQSDKPEPGDIRKHIKSLNSYISNKYHDTMYSKRTHRDADEDGNSPAKQSRARGGQAGNIGLGLQYGEHVYEVSEVVKGFTRAGFTLESNDEDEDGWAPLNQVKQRRTLSVDLN
jgi:hypothetical protein